jgi:hypothetical protein
MGCGFNPGGEPWGIARIRHAAESGRFSHVKTDPSSRRRSHLPCSGYIFSGPLPSATPRAPGGPHRFPVARVLRPVTSKAASGASTYRRCPPRTSGRSSSSQPEWSGNPTQPYVPWVGAPGNQTGSLLAIGETRHLAVSVFFLYSATGDGGEAVDSRTVSSGGLGAEPEGFAASIRATACNVVHSSRSSIGGMADPRPARQKCRHLLHSVSHVMRRWPPRQVAMSLRVSVR